MVSVLEERLAEDDTGYCELKVFQTIRLIEWKTTPDGISVFLGRTILLLIKTNPMHVEMHFNFFNTPSKRRALVKMWEIRCVQRRSAEIIKPKFLWCEALGSGSL